MRVLITGGSGYIGTATAWELLKHGYEVWIHDLVRPDTELVPINRMCFSLGDAPRPDAVIHLAAKTSVPESLRDPLAYYHANVAQTIDLLAWMRTYKVPKLVFASSAAVYTLSNTHPASTLLMPPPSPYGRSKLMCERILADCAAADGVSVVALRYFNVAGAIMTDEFQHGYRKRPPQHLIPLAVSKCVSGEPLPVFGRPGTDTEPVRDFVHVADVAEANRRALELDHTGFLALNVGTGVGTTVSQVVAEVEKATGIQVRTSVEPPRAGELRELVDRGRHETERVLGWAPSRGLGEIVRSDVEWFLHHEHHEKGGEHVGPGPLAPTVEHALNLLSSRARCARLPK